jgi:hypothetical protein
MWHDQDRITPEPVVRVPRDIQIARDVISILPNDERKEVFIEQCKQSVSTRLITTQADLSEEQGVRAIERRQV